MSKLILLIFIIFVSFLEAKSKNLITEDTSFSFKLCDKFDFKRLEISESMDAKDISDYREKYGEKETIELIKEFVC